MNSYGIVVDESSNSGIFNFIENEYCIRCRSRYDHGRDLSQSSTCIKDAAHLKAERSLGRMQKNRLEELFAVIRKFSGNCWFVRSRSTI